MSSRQRVSHAATPRSPHKLNLNSARTQMESYRDQSLALRLGDLLKFALVALRQCKLRVGWVIQKGGVRRYAAPSSAVVLLVLA